MKNPPKESKVRPNNRNPNTGEGLTVAEPSTATETQTENGQSITPSACSSRATSPPSTFPSSHDPAPALGPDPSVSVDTLTTLAFPPTPSSEPQFTTEAVSSKIAAEPHTPDINELLKSDHLYCPECYMPLHPDPKPEKLYIFLHARKYTTSLGAYETEMPEWARVGWTWDQS